MSNVVSMDEYRPHLSGKARCNGCNHEWQAVTAVGEVDEFECPKCGRMMGAYIYEFEPEERWECNCGCQSFYLVRGGAMCRVCGLETAEWLDV